MLEAGEFGWESDTLTFKVGDGTTAWNSLSYGGGGGGAPSGSAGGVLDGTYPNPGLAAGVAGNGLAETSNVLSVNVDGSTLEINSDALRVKDAGITEAKLGLADNTTNNASTSNHGLLKKLDNDSTHFMNGQGNWAAPAGGAPSGSAGGVLDGSYPNPGLAAGVAGAGLAETSDVLSVNVDGSTIEIATDTLQVKDAGITEAKLGLADNTTNNASTSKHGFLKKLDNSAAHFMDGQGNWSTPPGTAPGVAADTIWDAAGDLAVGSGADTAARLALGASGKVLKSNGTTAVWAFPPGYELDYVQKTTNTTISATTSAGATTIVTGSGFTADGSTRIKVEFWAYAMSYAADTFTVICLFEGSTELGSLCDISHIASSSTTVNGDGSIYGVTFLTPSSGSRTYSARGYRGSANSTVFAGDGTAGNFFPCFLRVTVA